MHELTEGIIDRLLAYYRDNLPGKLAALSSEYGDDVELRAPEEPCYYVGELELNPFLDYPKLFILGDRMEVERYSNEYTDATHQVSIIAALKNADPQTLRRQMYRWGRALWELTVARFFASTGADYFALHGEGDIAIDYIGPEGNDTGPIRSLQVSTAGEVIGKVVLIAGFSKQEPVYG